MMASRIEDYALIGDCETAALVSKNGSIDWLCWPRFDSGACFAAMLGTPENGRWLITASDPEARITRRYRPGTLVLETEIETATGAVTVVDFMPIVDNISDLVRVVIGRRGSVDMKMDLTLRFDYGTVAPWVTRKKDGAWRAIAGPNKVLLRSDVELHGEGLTTVGRFRVDADQTLHFSLTYVASHLPDPEPRDLAQALEDTQSFWRNWISRSTYRGAYRSAVERSLITLKAMTYAPTGGLVAAPTTSLPEQIGGERNWDYRFCWLRDATLTLLSLVDAGYREEACAWRDWLLRAVGGSPAQIQIMYGLAGERDLHELELSGLSGFEGSLPVRKGNGAAAQIQLDVFGEVMDALYQARRAGVSNSEAAWSLQVQLLCYLESSWNEPDHGIWEVRGPRRHFTHSKVMSWVAFDRAVRSVEEFELPGPVDQWRATRQTIYDEVCQRGFDPDLNSFVQSYDSKELDASLLLLPLVGFLPADDLRIQGTIAAIERSLMVDGLVLRYKTESNVDALPAGEGVFLACSFWFADNLVLQGRIDEAKALFERLLSLCNDVGLLAEEYDPRGKRQLGNFPQALSHLTLIGTALNLAQGSRPAEQRPCTSTPE